MMSSIGKSLHGKAACVGVGEEAGGYEGIHVAGMGGQLHVGHIPCDLLGLGIGLVGQSHGVGSCQGGVADVVEQLKGYIGEHADADGILHIDATADATGNIDAL